MRLRSAPGGSGAEPDARGRMALGEAAAPVLAALGGLSMLVAHPPLGWWPATFLAPALLLAALDVDARGAAAAGRPRRSGRLGGVLGLAFFAPLLHWLVLPAGFLGWALLVGVQAGWMALLGLLLGRIVDRWWVAPAAAVAWTGVDAWRAIVPLNGFEWGAIAYAHVDGSWLLPAARLVGGRGITLLVVLLSALAFLAVRRVAATVAGVGREGLEGALGGARGAVGALVATLLVSVLATIGPPATSGELDVVAVQGNDIRHWEEPAADPPLRITTAMRDLTLAELGRGPPPDLVVWPESSIDRDPDRERGRRLRPLVEEAVAATPRLLAGANLAGDDPAREFENTALLFTGERPARDAYRKRRLVPFGEYVPFRDQLDWLPPLEQVPRDAQPGDEPQALSLDGTPFAVAICFETLFGELVRENVLAGDSPARLLVVLTNNASFGDSAQPAQHLAQTRLRAVETGRWAVHGALSGSSAFVDPHGRAHEVTPTFTREVIRRSLPLATGRTPYLAVGDVLGVATRVLVAVAVLARAAIALGERRRRGARTPGTGRLPRP